MNKNKDKEKKKITPTIITKPKPFPNSKPVQTSHYESSWYKPAPIIDPSISSYYPQGQAILEQHGDELTFDNFINYFGNKIMDKDLVIINKRDEKSISKNKLSNERKYSIYATAHYVSLFVLASCVTLVILSIPYYFLVQDNILSVNISNLLIFVIILLIVFFISLASTLVLKESETRLKITLEASRLQLSKYL